MKRIKYLLWLFVVAIFLFNTGTALAGPVDLYFFHSDTCPHCQDEKLHLQMLQQEYPELTVNSYEINESNNIDLLYAISEAYETKTGGVPMTFIGEHVINGAQLDQITRLVKECSETEDTCISPATKAATQISAIGTIEENNDDSSNKYFTYGGVAAVIIAAVIGLYTMFKK